MSIRVTCECGKTLNLKDELEGKRIKCPDCQASLLVESGSGARKKKNGNGNGQKKGGKGMLIAILGALALALGCCCTGGVGFGGWWFWSGSSGATLEKKIVGKWVADVPKKGGGKVEDIMKLAMGGMIEFKADGTVLDASPMTPILQGKWKTISSKADIITVEMTDGRSTSKLAIKVVSNDSLRITPAASKTEFAFKRAS